MSAVVSVVPSPEVLSSVHRFSPLTVSFYLLAVCLYLRTVGVMSSSPPHPWCPPLCQPAKRMKMCVQQYAPTSMGNLTVGEEGVTRYC